MSDDGKALEMVETANHWASVGGDPARYTNEQQRQFAAFYVCNGGNATLAAELAGYANPNSQAHRLLTKPRVGQLIKRLTMANLDAMLPVAIGELARQIVDPKATNSDRRKAAESLLDRAGVRRSDGPSVAVQVNVGGDSPASAVVQSVWKNRDARLSGIAAPMQDSEPRTIEHRADGDPAPTPAAGRGGVAIKGPVAPGS